MRCGRNSVICPPASGKVRSEAVRGLAVALDAVVIRGGVVGWCSFKNHDNAVVCSGNSFVLKITENLKSILCCMFFQNQSSIFFSTQSSSPHTCFITFWVDPGVPPEIICFNAACSHYHTRPCKNSGFEYSDQRTEEYIRNLVIADARTNEYPKENFTKITKITKIVKIWGKIENNHFFAHVRIQDQRFFGFVIRNSYQVILSYLTACNVQ